jgi:alkyl hydroperoxide reductase subunit F
MYEMIIVGGGPAGLTAAVYAARKRLNCLLISANIGGQVNLTMRVENYMGYQFIEGPDLIDKFNTQVKQYPLEQKIGYKVSSVSRTDGGFEVKTEDGTSYQSRTVLYAAGKRPRKLNVPGEEKLGGRGVTYCAICDGPVFSGQKVAVIGGGNSALEAALDMVKITPQVHLVALSQLTGDGVLIDSLKDAANLTMYLEHQVQEIEGESLVEAIRIKDLGSGEERRLEVGGVFVEIGLVPNSEPVKDLVRLNQMGEVPVNRGCETGVPGLFAAGDVTDVPEKQIVVAAGEGAKAALQAQRYLQRLPR